MRGHAPAAAGPDRHHARSPRPAPAAARVDCSTPRRPSTAVVAALSADAGRYTWVAAAVGSQTAAGLQLGTQLPVMAIGGFNGSDPSPTLAQFQQYVADGQIHYFAGGGGVASARRTAAAAPRREISAWVAGELHPGDDRRLDLLRPDPAPASDDTTMAAASSPLSQQVVRFAGVGVLSTALHLGLFAALVRGGRRRRSWPTAPPSSSRRSSTPALNRGMDLRGRRGARGSSPARPGARHLRHHVCRHDRSRSPCSVRSRPTQAPLVQTAVVAAANVAVDGRAFRRHAALDLPGARGGRALRSGSRRPRRFAPVVRLAAVTWKVRLTRARTDVATRHTPVGGRLQSWSPGAAHASHQGSWCAATTSSIVVAAQVDPRADLWCDQAHAALGRGPARPADRLAPPVRREVEGGPVDRQHDRVGLALVDVEVGLDRLLGVEVDVGPVHAVGADRDDREVERAEVGADVGVAVGRPGVAAEEDRVAGPAQRPTPPTASGCARGRARRSAGPRVQVMRMPATSVSSRQSRA